MASETLKRVLIADDEPAARRRLHRLVSREDDFDVVAQACSGTEAVEAIERLHPDLAFLDVQMPGLSGIDVVGQVGTDRMPVVIFVTAFDEYAVHAFEMSALDYLLKPFDDDRFAETLERARQYLTQNRANEMIGRLETLLRAASREDGAEPSRTSYLKRIAVPMRGHVRIVPIEEISFISSSGKYVDLHVGGEQLLVEEQMQYLEEHLPPDQFFRLHRSYIVRLDEIELLLIREGGDYAVRLHDGRQVKASRGRWEELAVRLGIKGAEGDAAENRTS